jgi:hypothetical protein
MARTRTDHREMVLHHLAAHGPSRFAQLLFALGLPNDREAVRQLDYDLRCLRMAGSIHSVRGLWALTDP